MPLDGVSVSIILIILPSSSIYSIPAETGDVRSLPAFPAACPLAFTARFPLITRVGAPNEDMAGF